MSQSRSNSLFVGLSAGIALTSLAAILMGQGVGGASQPVKSEPQYFVTAEGDNAHLWVREGTTLRVVGHGQCTKCPWDEGDHKDGDHKEGDGHDHKKPATGK